MCAINVSHSLALENSVSAVSAESEEIQNAVTVRFWRLEFSDR